MHPRLFSAALAAAVLGLSACSGDGTGPGGDATLAAHEIAQLNQAILGVSAGVRTRDGASRSTAPSALGTGDVTFRFADTRPCEAGGRVGVDGTMDIAWDDAAGTGELFAAFAVEHAACGHRLEGGDVITVTGDPDIDVTLSAETGPDGIQSVIIRETGAFAWSRDGASGRCTVDVTASLDPVTAVATVQGSFCGVDVSGTVAQD